MGTPIDPPITPPPVGSGNSCSICWGAGKDFGNVDTPIKINVGFSGINKAVDWESWMTEPIDGVFELNQDAFAPCHFYKYLTDYMIDLYFRSTYTDLIVDGYYGGYQFNSDSSSPCSLFVFNDRNIRYTGGSCIITLPEVI